MLETLKGNHSVFFLRTLTTGRYRLSFNDRRLVTPVSKQSVQFAIGGMVRFYLYIQKYYIIDAILLLHHGHSIELYCSIWIPYSNLN